MLSKDFSLLKHSSNCRGGKEFNEEQFNCFIEFYAKFFSQSRKKKLFFIISIFLQTDQRTKKKEFSSKKEKEQQEDKKKSIEGGKNR